jgi:methylphosphotriester-DNA--protein-cysteine methyltransferase
MAFLSTEARHDANEMGHYALRAWPHQGIYHTQDCSSYRRTKAKRWFRTEADAVAAGFRRSHTCGWW